MSRRRLLVLWLAASACGAVFVASLVGDVSMGEGWVAAMTLLVLVLPAIVHEHRLLGDSFGADVDEWRTDHEALGEVIAGPWSR